MSFEKAAEAAEFLREKCPAVPDVAVVLGSGLGAFADGLDVEAEAAFSEIPGFQRTSVEGHAGRLIVADIGGVTALVQQGRFHFYEGFDMEQVMLPVRAFSLLGVKKIILTNAAGSLDPGMPPGSLMLITDHLNLMGVNPLRGPNDERFGPRFPDMTAVYDREFQDVASLLASEVSAERHERGVDPEPTDFLFRGVYCALSGPTYETPAEIRMYRLLGADAVGMSTVPEATAARHAGMRVLGISCITNFAAGMTEGSLDHNEVMETGLATAEIFGDLLRRTITNI